MNRSPSRRQVIKSMSMVGLAGITPWKFLPSRTLPPIRTITKGPKFHWFGYYDKREFDPTNRYVLCNQVEFEHRTPQANDQIRVGMVDTQSNDQWMTLGRSRAWGWQQGCMLQWLPNSDSEVVWNDVEGKDHVCRVMDFKTRKVRTLPRPIYSLSQDGKWAITVDFSRLQRMRPGYGYVGLEDPFHHHRAPAQSGVWKMDMESGESELIFSLADAAAIPHQGQLLGDKWNYFNHLLINPDGTRFIALHRWRESGGDRLHAEPKGPFHTRMFTVGMDGSDRKILDPSGLTSHFVWRDSNHICAWTNPTGREAGFYLFKDLTDELNLIGSGVMNSNGHISYVPKTDNEWILNDTYPDRVNRKQTVYLYHVPTNRQVIIGSFHSPIPYSGEWRCDTHPRCSNDGKTVAIDSPHLGKGRQVHLIDISKIIG